MAPHETLSPANRQKLLLATRVWSELLRQALERGFHGTVIVELAVQDGTIQHVRRRVEQTER
jgi:hypothetical protein